VAELNYHHLYYFWAIARERSLTRAAKRLHVSQSALSTQLRKLEERLGHPLFVRENRQLTLTEAGRIALEHAQAIFRTGDELVGALRGRAVGSRAVLRIGAVATLSRNWQLELFRPLLGRADVDLVLRSGTLRELLAQLGAHALDAVLSSVPLPRDAESRLHSQLLDRQPVGLVGRRVRGRRPLRFPEDLRTQPVVLPSLQSGMRAEFDRLLEDAGVVPTILAEVDDMAMLRLIARESDALSLVPLVVVQDELRSGVLIERHRLPQVTEDFYAITTSRRFPNPLLRELLEQGRRGEPAD
jgi:LysR family transcriptional activator of nhaA